MRLIDADALIKKWENVHCEDMSFEMALIGATNDVKNAPTVNAVLVKPSQLERIATVETLLSEMLEEFKGGRIDTKTLQIAVYCQTDINRIVYTLNKLKQVEEEYNT